LADGRAPGLEQHIYCGQRPDRQQLAPGLVWRDFFDAQRAADHSGDCGHLLELAQRLRPGQNIFRSGVSIPTQRTHRDRRVDNALGSQDRDESSFFKSQFRE